MHPSDENQKQKILDINRLTIAQIKIGVEKTKAETERKAVIFGVPTSEPDDVVVEMLKEQGASESYRVFKTLESKEKVPTETWILTFPSSPPLNVVLAYRSFPIMDYKRKATQCTKCWMFGHTSKRCENLVKCRVCAENHEGDVPCTAPSKCHNCSSGTHTAGSSDCTVRQFRQKVLDTATQRNVPFQVAKSMFTQSSRTPRALPTPSTPNVIQTQTDPAASKEMDTMRKNIDSLQAQLNELKASVQPLLPLAEEIAINNLKLDSLHQSVKELTDSLVHLISPFQKVCLLAPIVPSLLTFDESPPYSPYPTQPKSPQLSPQAPGTNRSSRLGNNANNNES